MEGEIHQNNIETRSEQVANYALIGINRAWEIINDVDSLPLSVDFNYQQIAEHLKENATSFGRALFNMARDTQGEERLKYIQGLERAMIIIRRDDKEKFLSNIMTTSESIQELHRKAEEELPTSGKIREKTSVLRELISLLFSRFKK